MLFPQKLLILFMFLCMAQGFIFTSKGTMITERVKTAASVITISFLIQLIILAVVRRSVILAVAAVAFYFLYPGAGRVITLLAMKKAKSVGIFSWVMLVLAVAAAYCTISGRVVVQKAAADSTPASAYVASINSDKFHRPSCDYAGNILAENRVYYRTAEEAKNAGKTPCSVCRP